MRRLWLLATLALAGLVSAKSDVSTQPGGVAYTPNISVTHSPAIAARTVLSNNASESSAAPSAITTGLAHVIDVRAYGAKCDADTAATDDSAAWQAAINAAAAVPYYEDVSPYGPLSAILQGCQTGQSIIKTSLDFSRFTGNYNHVPAAAAFTVDMTGSCLIGQTNGTPVINALGARFIHWRNLCIYGSSTRTPNVGIQIGRNSTLHSADEMYFDHAVVEGQFTLAAFYNFASETNLFLNAFIDNWYASGMPYALIEDGINHFGISTAPPNTAQSMNGNTWIGAVILGSSVGHAIWIGGVDGLYFRQTYISTEGTTAPPVILYSIPSRNNVDIVMDTHIEGAGSDLPTADFLVSGTLATPNIIGFEYHDYYNEATSSLFALDAGVTSFTLTHAKIDVDAAASTPAIFDVAADYSLSGDVDIPSSSMWRAPASFSGKVCYRGFCRAYQNIGDISNTSVGAYPPAFASTVTGTSNTLIGYQAGTNLTSGDANTALGANALAGNSSAPNIGSHNTAIGSSTLYNCQGVCADNTALGWYAGNGLTTGTYNIFLGTRAGAATTTGVNNILLGYNAQAISATSSAEINIGNLLYYNTTSTSAPALISCGSIPSGSIDAYANNRSGTVTVGGNTATCTLTFAGGGYNTWNHCRVTPHTAAAGFSYAYTKQAIKVTATVLGGVVLDYDCDGY